MQHEQHLYKFKQFCLGFQKKKTKTNTHNLHMFFPIFFLIFVSQKHVNTHNQQPTHQICAVCFSFFGQRKHKTIQTQHMQKQKNLKNIDLPHQLTLTDVEPSQLSLGTQTPSVDNTGRSGGHAHFYTNFI